MTATKEELLEADKILRPIFYNDLLMAGMPRLWARLKAIGNGRSIILYRVAFAWYDNQEVVQMFKRLKPVQTVYHIKTTAPLKVVFLDTMFVGDISIVCVMDLFSKFASVSYFRKPIDSKSTTTALKQFLEKTGSSVDDIGEFRVDGGSEYMGDFQQFIGNEKRIVSLAYKKQQMSPVERFNGTLRRFLERMFEVRGKPINWPQKYIPEAVRVYNEELEHGATGYTPKEALTSPEAQRVIRRAQIQRSPPSDLKQGDTVRIVARDIQNVFDRKIRANWTRELYKIDSVRGSVVTLTNGDASRNEGVPSVASNKVMTHEVMKIDPNLLFKIPERPAVRTTAKKPRSRLLREIDDYLTAPPVKRSLRSRDGSGTRSAYGGCARGCS